VRALKGAAVGRAISRLVLEGSGARTNETAFSEAIQQFEGGRLFWNGNVCFVLFEDSTWIMF